MLLSQSTVLSRDSIDTDATVFFNLLWRNLEGVLLSCRASDSATQPVDSAQPVLVMSKMLDPQKKNKLHRVCPQSIRPCLRQIQIQIQIHIQNQTQSRSRSKFRFQIQTQIHIQLQIHTHQDQDPPVIAPPARTLVCVQAAPYAATSASAVGSARCKSQWNGIPRRCMASPQLVCETREMSMEFAARCPNID